MCVTFVRVRCVGGWLDCGDVEGEGGRSDGTTETRGGVIML
jgi:hypothetical protein